MSTVRGFSIKKINLSPATVQEEILQNVAIIISTIKGSDPMGRDIGLRGDFIDKPVTVARVLLVSEIMEAMSQLEPRAEVLDVTFEISADNPDVLIPIVEVNINA